MASDLPDPKQLGVYVVLGQVGLEMVAPVVLGLLLDHWLEWMPWLTVSGALVGLVGGVMHLVVLMNRRDPSRRQPRDEP
ncbi:MAG: AtpZ/AtpI family protein [Gemmataceae bacterium]|nr:AtpZ/AtpI family protein [Gemmataceae bacterium]